MGFRTKLDFSDNRQVKQRIETNTVLSGATAFGVPFSALPTGPNPTFSSVTQTLSFINSTFSGNNTTTVFTWGDSRMTLGESALSAITPSNSATTQSTGDIFTADLSSAVVVDGNTSYTSYTGVSYDISVSGMTDLGGGDYSGTVSTLTLRILGAQGLDFTGRTIWNDVSGITRTDRLIITDDAFIGKVFMCNSSEGMGKWETLTGLTATTALWTNDGVGGGAIRSTNGVTHTITGNSDYSIIAGGYVNSIYDSDASFIGSSTGSFISGSSLGFILTSDGSEVRNSDGAGIIGGQANFLYDSNYGIIAGGTGHQIDTSSTYSSIFGGRIAEIHDSDWSTVVGSNVGYINGGNHNGIFSSQGSSITGSSLSHLFGGYQNVIHGGLSGNSYNAIYGGHNNLIDNHRNSFIIGGSGNTIHFDLADYAHDYTYESILNSLDSTISASTNAQINNSNYVFMGNTILSSIRNSVSNLYETNITGTYDPLDYNTNGLNTIDSSIDVRILNKSNGVSVSNSQTIKIDGGYSGGVLSKINILGSSDIEIDGATNEFASRYVGVYNTETSYVERGLYGFLGGNRNVTVNTGLTFSIIGTRDTTMNNSYYSSIIGGYAQTMSNSIYSGIFGGSTNEIDTALNYGWGSIIGGDTNYVYGLSNYFTIIGGGNNVISDSNGAILVSESSQITNNMDYSAILVGTNNTMTATLYTGPANTIMAGGNNNYYRNTGIFGLNNSAMLGGQNMTIDGITNMNSMITSYQSNMTGTISLNTFIGNDNCNLNTGTESVIIGSEQSNLRNVYQSMLLGTYQSTISGSSTVTSSFILGGEKHTITGPSGTADYSSIINGSTNTIGSAKNAIIIGGSNVRISGSSDQSVAILAKDSYIDGASINSGLYNTELSLITNSSAASIITGGYVNRILSSNYSSVLGGVQNIISGSSSFYNSIIGGVNNRLFGTTLGTTIISSSESKIYTSQYSIILGGYQNIISGSTYGTGYNTILGGSQNAISGDSLTNSSILGGSGNVLTGTRSAIIGGQNIVGTANDTVYVPDLVIDGLTSTDPIATDVNGKIVAGTSDARLKQNINTLSDSLNIIKNLRGVSFEYTPESEMGGGIRYGFIAQEVQKHVPTIVRDRAKGDGMLSLNYNEIVPILVEAVKELSTGTTSLNNTYLETQTILAEDNNIDLNYNGTQETAIGGGLRVLHAKGQDLSAELITDNNGDFVTNNDFKPSALTIPFYTPSSSNDEAGNEGNITRDDNYLYVKTSSGWKRTNLESF